MKIYFYIAVLVLSLTACSNEPSVEEKLYSCYESMYDEIDVDLSTELDRLEQAMIAEGLLSDNGGLAKKKYFDNVRETGKMKSLQNREVCAQLKKLSIQDLLNHPPCISKISKQDSIAYTKSQFYRTIKKIRKKATKGGAIHMGNISEVFAKNISAENYEMEFYRAMFLISIAISTDIDVDELTELEQIREKNESHNIGNFVEFILRSDEEVMIGGKVVHIDEAKDRLRQCMDSAGFQPNIIVSSKTSTKYGVFIKAHNAIDNYYKDLYNSEAQLHYQKKYDQLSSYQQDQIKHANPKKIIETEY